MGPWVELLWPYGAAFIALLIVFAFLHDLKRLKQVKAEVAAIEARTISKHEYTPSMVRDLIWADFMSKHSLTDSGPGEAVSVLMDGVPYVTITIRIMRPKDGSAH